MQWGKYKAANFYNILKHYDSFEFSLQKYRLKHNKELKNN